jgi:hypothetical protein
MTPAGSSTPSVSTIAASIRACSSAPAPITSRSAPTSNRCGSRGHVITRATAPYGSFDLGAAGPYVVTTSLFRGTIAIYNRKLHLLRVRVLAPSAEDVALTTL